MAEVSLATLTNAENKNIRERSHEKNIHMHILRAHLEPCFATFTIAPQATVTEMMCIMHVILQGSQQQLSFS